MKPGTGCIMMNHGATSNTIAEISAETMVGAEPSPNRVIAT
jgi:hypothetical protein